MTNEILVEIFCALCMLVIEFDVTKTINGTLTCKLFSVFSFAVIKGDKSQFAILM